eukprot:scaffold20491_cov70-Phaeocystis_antarctica.AAC.2
MKELQASTRQTPAHRRRAPQPSRPPTSAPLSLCLCRCVRRTYSVSKRAEPRREDRTELKIVRRSTPLLRYPPNVSGTPTLGLYQPRALCAVASHLLPGLRSDWSAEARAAARAAETEAVAAAV